MKKITVGSLLLAMLIAFAGCSTVTSAFAYPAPVDVADTRVFVGHALRFDTARQNAVSAGISERYTKIISETTEFNNGIGEVYVYLTMIK